MWTSHTMLFTFINLLDFSKGFGFVIWSLVHFSGEYCYFLMLSKSRLLFLPSMTVCKTSCLPHPGLRRGRPGRYVPDTSVTSPTSSSMLNPVQPSPYFTPTPGITPSPLNPPSAPPQFFSPTVPSTASPMYGDPQQQQPVQLPPKTPAALDSTVPRGWNDPPPPSSSRKVRMRVLMC